MRRGRSSGFTLVEVTIILLVLVILGAILLPTIERFIDLAKWVRVREDVGMIAAIIELWKVDNCSRFFKQDGDGPATSANRVDLIVGLGDIAGNSFVAAPNTNWNETIDPVAPGDNDVVVDTMDNQLVLGDPFGAAAGDPYPRPVTNNPFECGFRGAYIGGPITADPWGNRYMINVAYLGPRGTRPLGALSPPGFNQYDVFVLSAGADEVIDTPFLVDGVVAGGDDAIALVSGGY